MKRNFVVVSLIFVLIAVGSFGQSQIIAPPISPPPSPADVQVSAQILGSLISKYVIMLQQYQSSIQEGGTPDSSIEFRLSARILVPEEEMEAELGSILPGVSEMTFWLRANIFARHPYVSKINLSGSLGNIEILSTQTEVVIVSHDEAVYSVIPMRPDLEEMSELIPLVGFGLEDIPGIELDFLTFLGFLQQDIGDLLLQYLPNVDMEYGGQELTPKGMAHVVRLTFSENGLIVALWILDDTWGLYKVGIDDPAGGGGSAVIIIEEFELVKSTLPDSTFDIYTESLAELELGDLISIIGLKVLSAAVAGTPVAADLSLSALEISQGETVVVQSNGLDTEDRESDLTAEIEYRSSGGSWTLLPADYVGASAPFGRWEGVFGPPISETPGVYDFRVTYTDSSGAVSDPLELLGALEVIPIPPQVVSVSPEDGASDVLVNAQIAVSFDREMDRASVEFAFSLTDSSGQSVSGLFEWTDTAFSFRPDQGLMYGQDYLVKVLGTAVGLNGASLDTNMDGIGGGTPEDDLVWEFTTEFAPLPIVSGFSPGGRQRNVLVSERVSVTFTEAMDQASVEDAFSVVSSEGQMVSGAFQWSDNALTFIPSQDLEYNTTYHVKVRGSAKSDKGAGLDANANGIAEGSPEDDLSWWFSTEEFPVIALKPASQIAMPGEMLTLDVVAQSVCQLRSFKLTVGFDPEILEILKVERKSFAVWRPRPKRIEDVDMWQPTVIDKEGGFVTIGADSTRSGGVTGSGTIAVLTFKILPLVKGAGGISTSIQLRDTSFADAAGEAISPELRDSEVQVTEFPVYDVNGDGVVNILDLVMIQEGEASPASASNALGNNYPNPFNPETWIPYSLANGGDVVISIYNSAGAVVRTLDLGYRQMGRYTTRSAAAYWDGTNEAGERVASGVYYYRISAGGFSAVRKMVVLD